MTMAEYARLIELARGLNVRSRGGAIAELRRKLGAAVAALRRDLARELIGKGVQSTEQRDSVDMDFDPSDRMRFTEPFLRREHLGASVEELVAGVASGDVQPTDRQLRGLSDLARTLREATVEVTYLSLLPGVGRKVTKVQCLGPLEGGSLWQAPGGHFVVRYAESHPAPLGERVPSRRPRSVFVFAANPFGELRSTQPVNDDPARDGQPGRDVSDLLAGLTTRLVAERIAGRMRT